MLIAVFGLPGSGKSYFASHLAQRMGAIYLSSDVIRKEITSEPSYSNKAKKKVYQMLFAKAGNSLKAGENVILDATFHKAQRRAQAQKLSDKIYWIGVFAPEEIIRERLAHDRENSDADFSVYQKIKNEFEPLDEPYLRLKSTNKNLEEMLEKAIEYLGFVA